MAYKYHRFVLAPWCYEQLIKYLVVVLCSPFVVMTTWGFTNSFGSFQTYVTDRLNRSLSTIAWIGSTQIFLLFFLGTITGRLTDTGHFRKVFFAGLLATVVGIFASSFCHRFKEYLVTLGIAVGVGNGCLFCAMLTVMSSYFDKKRAIAIGVAACGSASGVVSLFGDGASACAIHRISVDDACDRPDPTRSARCSQRFSTSGDAQKKPLPN